VSSPRIDAAALLPTLALVSYAVLVDTPRFELVLVAAALAFSTLLTPTKVENNLGKHRLRRALIVYLPIALMGAWVTLPAWSAHVPFVGIDGQINEAIVAEIADHSARGTPLTWITRISTGEPTLDLYPTIVHRIIAWLAVHTGTSHLLSHWLVSIVSVAYTLVAIGIARTAMRVSGNEAASLAAGALALLDTGSDFTWGTRPTFLYGFLPSTLSIALALNVFPILLDLARQARTTRVLVAVLGVACSAALHPLCLVIYVISIGTLFVSWMIGTPRTQRKTALPLLALVIGLALSAFVWAPGAARIVTYGVHYGTPEVRLDEAFDAMRIGRLPDGSFAALIALAWAAVITAFVSRKTRVETRWIAAVALLFVFAYVNIAFLDFGLAPSATSVRWQSFRIGAIVKPLVYVLGAYAFASGGELVRAFRSHTALRLGVRTAALLSLAALLFSDREALVQGLQGQHAQREADMAGPTLTEPAALSELRQHLIEEVRRTPAGVAPGRIVETCSAACAWEVFRFVRNADGTDSGVSFALRQAAPAGFMLRDQFATMSPANLRRFGVRWILTTQGDPPEGNPATERVFGRLTLREVPNWTGELGHIERGAGQVQVRTVQGEGFDITLSGTTAPALVSLGTPYYARLRATHESGTNVPVYAFPVAPESEGAMVERSAAMWLSPGTTRLRADGALPTDGRGRFVSLAALLGLALLSQRRIRAYILSFKLAAPRTRRLTLAALAFLACIAFPARSWFAPADALRFGTFFPRPSIRVEVEGHEVACTPNWLGRIYHCPDDVDVAMVITHSLQDWHIGWPIPAPAVEIRGGRSGSVYTVELPSTTLHGDYLANCSGCRTDIEVLSQPERTWSGIFGTTVRRELEGRGLRVRIAPHGGEARMTLLSTRFLDPEPMPAVPEHP
jgi:hypothetical protein